MQEKRNIYNFRCSKIQLNHNSSFLLVVSPFSSCFIFSSNFSAFSRPSSLLFDKVNHIGKAHRVPFLTPRTPCKFSSHLNEKKQGVHILVLNVPRMINRCALPIWFTLSNKSEDGRGKC